MPDDHVSVVFLMIIVLPAFVPPAKANNGGPFLRKNVCEGTARPFRGIAMFVVQITTKLRDEVWFARCVFEQTRVCLTHLKGEIFSVIFHLPFQLNQSPFGSVPQAISNGVPKSFAQRSQALRSSSKSPAIILSSEKNLSP